MTTHTSVNQGALFVRDNDMLYPQADTAGPWYPNSQHGSAMLLMAALALEGLPAERPVQVTRLTVDMLSAAPLAPVEVRTEVRKSGQYLESLEVTLHSAGRDCVLASALRYRTDDVPVSAERLTYQLAPPVLPGPLAAPLFAEAAGRAGFHRAMEIRLDATASPAIIWFRLTQAVLSGQPITPLQRAAAAADWTYSVPNLAHHIVTGERFGKLPYYGINPDTTINLHRPAEGEWIGIQTQATYGNLGSGTVMGQLFDETGPFGFVTQSILIRPRT